MFVQSDKADRIDGVSFKSAIEDDDTASGWQDLAGDAVEQGLRQLFDHRRVFHSHDDRGQPSFCGAFQFLLGIGGHDDPHAVGRLFKLFPIRGTGEHHQQRSRIRHPAEFQRQINVAGQVAVVGLGLHAVVNGLVCGRPVMGRAASQLKSRFEIGAGHRCRETGTLVSAPQNCRIVRSLGKNGNAAAIRGLLRRSWIGQSLHSHVIWSVLSGGSFAPRSELHPAAGAITLAGDSSHPREAPCPHFQTAVSF
jgi:hypothetical protein